MGAERHGRVRGYGLGPTPTSVFGSTSRQTQATFAKAPSVFNVRNVSKTLGTRTQGTKIASRALSTKKIRLRAEDVQGRNVLTNFWGMDFTTNKLRSLVRKWQTLIEAHVDVRTTDNYGSRMFCIGFTKRPPNQVDKIVLADGSRILGLGDLGIQGIGIAIGKLDLYFAAAGINPQRILPGMIDVGTNNENVLNHPLCS
ncbi:hypothetical protein MRB53_016826 [Persea americana]|uniref:Uncharacterized protein n=1 Tax=Persea americana TaxID=3435 RepID=A0ACC2M378_PERAE|nr:hypothetical protein MRB53_016826 [Persea americana]